MRIDADAAQAAAAQVLADRTAAIESAPRGDSVISASRPAAKVLRRWDNGGAFCTNRIEQALFYIQLVQHLAKVCAQAGNDVGRRARRRHKGGPRVGLIRQVITGREE